MNRRDALRLLAAAAAIPLAPHGLLAALREARASVATATAPRTLNAHQDATVTALAEMILPKTDTPGATDVGASQFIDLMLTEWYDEPERVRFLKGLDDVDSRTQNLFSKDFISSAPAQQAQILTWLGEQLAEVLERQNEHPASLMEGPMESAEAKPPETFYLMLRRLVLTAYYTSEAGATDELHFEIIPDHFDGCAEVPSAKGEASSR